MLPLYVLNLSRRPDRWQRFQRWNQQPDLELIRVEAVEGRDLDRAQLEQTGILGRRSEHFTLGHIGCALSHRLMWQRCLDQDRPLVICEDDAILRSDLARVMDHVYGQLGSDWDMVLLGYNFNSALDVELIPGIDLHSSFVPNTISDQVQRSFVGITTETTALPRIFPLNNAFGTCAYGVSPQGARQLIEYCFPLTGLAVAVPALKRILQPAGSIDTILNAHYRGLQAFCTIPPLALASNDPQDSDTMRSQP